MSLIRSSQTKSAASAPPMRLLPIRPGCFATLLLFLVLTFPARLDAQTPYQLKAAVLGSLAKFVEWPADSFAEPTDPIRLGVLGEDPFGADLAKILGPIRINSRVFQIERSRRVQDLLECHIVFVPATESDRMEAILSQTGTRPILLVGEDPRWLQSGGVVNFHMEDRKVRFSINLAAAEKRGVSIHTQALRLATTVIRKDGSQ